MAARYDGLGYRVLKEEAAAAVLGLLEPMRRRYEEIRTEEGELSRLLAAGADTARSVSAPTLEAMFERMGFVPPSVR